MHVANCEERNWSTRYRAELYRMQEKLIRVGVESTNYGFQTLLALSNLKLDLWIVLRGGCRIYERGGGGGGGGGAPYMKRCRPEAVHRGA